ncbi:MAG: hypothetical protein JW993_03495 [Sedimentisphaerales bacterium]|nr:hypothetical protein [Sedimentisphaerales bacterium]
MRSLSHYTGERVYRALQPLKRYAWARRSYGNLRYVVHVCTDCIPHIFLKRLVKYDGSLARQAVLTYKTTLPESASADNFLRLLSEKGIEYHQGRHTFYLPPQEGLEKVLGAFVANYPADAGFKILKNIGSGEHHSYLNGDPSIHPWMRRVLIGSPQDVFDGACLAEILDLGPRVYDLVTLQNGALSLTCYVVEHVKGHEPSIDDYAGFMERLKSHVDKGILGISVPEGLERPDFAPPHCNGNLIKGDDGKCYYIDFQLFILKDRSKAIDSILEREVEHFHFGHPHFLTRKRFLYQEIPGVNQSAKRDTRKRWSAVRALLDAQGVRLKDRLLLDICCNTGMMLACGLSEGAFWGLGWDLPEVASPASRIQRMLGNSRLHITGCKLSEDYILTKDIPSHLQSRLDGSVVFYLAASQHIGFLRELANIPWQMLVYEGHQSDDATTVAKSLERMKREWQCDMVARRTIRDGYCGERPLALMIRRNR